MFSRILMPVAFSARCQGAAQYAEALTLHFRSQLVLLHVVTPIPAYSFQEGMPLPPDVMEDMLEHGKAQLALFAAEWVKGVAAGQVVLEGDPSQQIVDYAAAEKFDLILMPTHGYGPFRRFLLGSVTAKVVHDADCPVWTGPHMESAPAYPSIAFRKVLCAIDLGMESRAILEWGAGFAREYGADLAVVHAIAKGFDSGRIFSVKQEARDRISSLQEELGIQGGILVEAGDAAEAVRAAAESTAADMLVIGRGRAAGHRGRLRTHSYAILRESPCPVVAI